MVTLVQQQTIPTSGNHSQKEQEQSNGDVVAENETQGRQVEVAQPAKNTAVTVAGNGSLAGSSTQCSDVDDDDDEDETDVDEDAWVPDLPVPAVLQHHQQVTTADGNLVLPNADTSNFGDVCVKNSTNVHLGSKTFYKGPVTIKQFVYTNPLTSAQEHDDAVKCDIGHASDINIANAEADAPDNSYLAKHPDLDKVVKWLWTWRCAAFSCVLALILVTTVVVTSIYVAHNTATPPAPVFPEIPDSSLGVTGVKVRNVRFVERNEWGAQPPSEQLQKMKLPVPYVIISHTVTDFCSTQSQCTFHVRFAQTFHIESRKWSDIGYSFLVGGDGLVYVGRSWDYIGAHSFGFNNISIGISFIGTFNSVKPPKNQLYAAQRVIELGVEGGKIAPDYKLLGHRQISGTLSPGDALYSVIKTWPHWSPKP